MMMMMMMDDDDDTDNDDDDDDDADNDDDDDAFERATSHRAIERAIYRADTSQAKMVTWLANL